MEEITTKQTKNDESVLNMNKETALIKLEKQLINVRKKYKDHYYKEHFKKIKNTSNHI